MMTSLQFDDVTMTSFILQLMDAVVQVLVKDPNTAIVAECPKLITANEVESKQRVPTTVPCISV